jgi:hypothetical protein
MHPQRVSQVQAIDNFLSDTIFPVCSGKKNGKQSDIPSDFVRKRKHFPKKA